MSCTGSNVSDYVHDIPMEVNEYCFPPPVILMREKSLCFPLEALDIEYDFTVEKKAVNDFHRNEEEKMKKEEKKKRFEDVEHKDGNEKLMESVTELETQSGDVHNSSSGSEFAERYPTDVNETESRSQFNGTEIESFGYCSAAAVVASRSCIDILQPQPVTFSKNNRHTRKSSGSQKYSLLEDFEPTAWASPFDALAIKTMNDKELLKQILDPVTVGGNRRESNGFLPGASVANVTVSTSTGANVHSKTHGYANDNQERLPALLSRDLNQSWPLSQLNDKIQSTNRRSLGSHSVVLKESTRFSPTTLVDSHFGSRQPDVSRHNAQLTGLDRKQILPLSLKTNSESYHQAYDNHFSPLKPSSSSPDLTKLTPSEIFDRTAKIRNEENPELLISLRDSERKITDSISPMGFSVAQIVRAMRKLRTDDKRKIVAYLLSVQSFCLSGWDPEIVEEAVFYSENNDEKARQFIRAAVQLRDLGFEEPKIFAALKLCDCSRDQALDYLLSN